MINLNQSHNVKTPLYITKMIMIHFQAHSESLVPSRKTLVEPKY